MSVLNTTFSSNLRSTFKTTKKITILVLTDFFVVLVNISLFYFIPSCIKYWCDTFDDIIIVELPNLSVLRYDIITIRFNRKC